MKLSSLFALTCAVIIASATASLRNEKVTTFIDVSSQLVTVSSKISVVNKLIEPVKSYIYLINTAWRSNLSYVEAYDSQQNSLHVNKVDVADSMVNVEILFHNPLFPDETEKLEVLTVFTDCLRPYPRKVKQNEKLLVLFAFNAYFYSSYFTEIQTTTVHPGRTQVTAVDGEIYKMTNDTRYGLHYGPYFNIAPESKHVSVIHYEMLLPLLTVEKLERFIQISQWGYINIRDQISLLNSGPTFVGPYERPYGKPLPDSRVEVIISSLPEYAYDIYVKDEIGRISSFEVDEYQLNRVDVHMKPRFILYGGWKTQYEMGYTLPIPLYVKNKDQFYNLVLPLIDKIFPNLFVKEMKVNIILPEGAVFQHIIPHFDLENNTKRHCDFMDVLCRDVVSFTVHNLVDHHCKTSMSLTFSYFRLLMLMKPIVIATFLYSLLLSFLAYSRLTSSKGHVRSTTLRHSQHDQAASKQEPSHPNQTPANKDKEKKSKVKSKQKQKKVYM